MWVWASVWCVFYSGNVCRSTIVEFFNCQKKRNSNMSHKEHIYTVCLLLRWITNVNKRRVFSHFLTNIKNGVTEILSMKHKFNWSLSTGWLECSIFQRHVIMYFRKMLAQNDEIRLIKELKMRLIYLEHYHE